MRFHYCRKKIITKHNNSCRLVVLQSTTEFNPIVFVVAMPKVVAIYTAAD